ncbi:MAG TPA: serine hydrolase domain-containing protein [Streptosporangiaceae bacterium]|jgi:CubicO group peptidase (beta-lactamase class C family)
MLSEFVRDMARELRIPGVAVGVWADGQEDYACDGVTSLDNPLPVDRHTLFEVGSVTKSFTATALMRLVEGKQVELDAPVRRYVPDLRLQDEASAAAITVGQLLNHSAGLDWALLVDTGAGDDALAAFVARLPGLKLIGAPGARASYSQAGYNLAGRVIEAVTGLTYEDAITSLLLRPLGLAESFYTDSEVMTRRFAVGHNPGDDGKLTVARQWRRWRSNNPGGGLVSSVTDQLRWARFHLGDGRAEGGQPILPAGLLQQMREPTIALHGSTLGDALGICWFLRVVDGVRTVGHGGSAHGQFAELLMVPERNLAVVSAANAGPDGIPFNQAVVRWVLERYLGVTDRDPQPLPHDPARAREYAGAYENGALRLVIAADDHGMTLAAGIKPEIRAASDTEMPPDYPPAGIGLLPGNGDEYILTEGGMKGQRGFFTRDDAGLVNGLELAGRGAARVPAR